MIGLGQRDNRKAARSLKSILGFNMLGHADIANMSGVPLAVLPGAIRSITLANLSPVYFDSFVYHRSRIAPAIAASFPNLTSLTYSPTSILGRVTDLQCLELLPKLRKLVLPLDKPQKVVSYMPLRQYGETLAKLTRLVNLEHLCWPYIDETVGKFTALTYLKGLLSMRQFNYGSLTTLQNLKVLHLDLHDVAVTAATVEDVLLMSRITTLVDIKIK